MKRLALAPETIADALKRKRRGETWGSIAKSLGVSLDGLRRHRNPECRRKYNARALRWYEANGQSRARNRSVSVARVLAQGGHAEVCG